MQKFVFSFSIILLSLAAGYTFKAAIRAGALRVSERTADRIRNGLQKSAMLVLNPVAFCGAVWVLDLGERRYLALPFVGLTALVTGLLLGLAGSHALRMPPAQAGVYAPCGSFTNIGNIGGLVTFVLLGEAGYALVPFYKLFEELWYYGVLFPLARAAGGRVSPGKATGAGRPGGAASLLHLARDPFLIVALTSIALGLGLNAAGVPRPSAYAGLNTVIVPLSSFAFLFSIGMKMRFMIHREHVAAAVMLVGSKALVVPAVAFGVATLAGLGSTEGGIGLKVALILGAMPVGFLGLVPPALFGLDEELANSLWLASNAALVLIVPVLGLIIGAL